MLDEWLGSLRSPSTKQVYVASLRHFMRTVFGEGDFNKFVEEYIVKVKNGRDPFKDLLTYADSLKKKPPKTVGAYIHGVSNFLEYTFDFELTRKQRRILRNRMPKGKRARTVEDRLTRDRLKEILTQCDTKGRALFLLLLSAGLRIGEALQLEVDDIEGLRLRKDYKGTTVVFESDPVKVNVRGEYTKSGDKYYSFISWEAKEHLTEWLKIRHKYLRSSAKRGRGLEKKRAKKGLKRGERPKPEEDKRIFPFSFTVASALWNNSLKKAGLENHDKGTNRRTLHIHMLRKVFRTQLGAAGVPRDIIEALMGHAEGLDAVYRSYSEEQLKKEYLKGESHLLVFASPDTPRVSRLEKTVQRYYELTLELMKTIEKLDEKNQELKKDLHILEMILLDEDEKKEQARIKKILDKDPSLWDDPDRLLEITRSGQKKEETQTPQKTSKVAQKEKPLPSPPKTEMTSSKISLTAQAKDCPECGEKGSLKDGFCSECGYRERTDFI